MEEFQSDDAQGPERPPSGWAAPTAPHPGVQRAALDRRAVSGRDRRLSDEHDGIPCRPQLKARAAGVEGVDDHVFTR